MKDETIKKRSNFGSVDLAKCLQRDWKVNSGGLKQPESECFDNLKVAEQRLRNTSMGIKHQQGLARGPIPFKR